jgi:hypothetical protein
MREEPEIVTGNARGMTVKDRKPCCPEAIFRSEIRARNKAMIP